MRARGFKAVMFGVFFFTRQQSATAQSMQHNTVMCRNECLLQDDRLFNAPQIFMQGNRISLLQIRKNDGLL